MASAKLRHIYDLLTHVSCHIIDVCDHIIDVCDHNTDVYDLSNLALKSGHTNVMCSVGRIMPATIFGHYKPKHV